MSSFKELLQSMTKGTADVKPAHLLEQAGKELNNDKAAFVQSLQELADDKLAAKRARVAGYIAADAKGEQRCTWKNTTENVVVQPLQYFKPESLQELRSIILQAEKNNVRVRAIGSGHSFSDVCQTNDYLIDSHGLKGVRSLREDLLKPGAKSPTLFHVESGITIRDLNNELDSRGLALANMGGYDAQTIVGATSTCTHGSGLSLASIADSIVSVVLVSDGAVVYRIEPSDGITDPDKYKQAYPDNILVQDDNWFNTVIVSMGSTGVFYSVYLRVVPRYWLKEVRWLSTWQEEKERLRQGDVLQNNRHYEVYVNPYKVDGKNSCLITTRNKVEEPGELPADKENRNWLTELLGDIPGITNILDLIFETVPGLTPEVINSSLRGLVDDSYVNKSYKVLNIGSANNVSAYSAEIGYPLKDDMYIKATDRILELAERSATLGNVYHTAPISLRFVRQSRAFLSPQHAADTCMIEMPMVNGTHGGYEILRALEPEMMKFSGRPHWGQLNFLSGSYGLVSMMYPRFPEFLTVFNALNSRGTFDNSFTDRVGFSPRNFRKPSA